MLRGSDVNQIKGLGESEVINETSALKNGKERLNEILRKVQ